MKKIDLKINLVDSVYYQKWKKTTDSHEDFKREILPGWVVDKESAITKGFETVKEYARKQFQAETAQRFCITLKDRDYANSEYLKDYTRYNAIEDRTKSFYNNFSTELKLECFYKLFNREPSKWDMEHIELGRSPKHPNAIGFYFREKFYGHINLIRSQNFDPVQNHFGWDSFTFHPA